MIHLGDITKINGATVPPVNVIIGGSPCQDLSVAGKRAGLAGKRSGLFMEQIRIIKEMRQNDKRAGRSDEFIRPRFMVWENVPGAFSSNKGEDFRAVLEETVRVVDKAAVIPRPSKGKWSTSGAIMGDGWSIAWRVLDAQFWGVPQRRRRIALVADFGGQSAAEILFERNGVSGNIEASGAQRQGTAADSENGVGAADLQGVLAFHITQDPISGDVAPCLSSENSAAGQCMCGIVYDARGNGDGSILPTLTGDHESRITDYTAIVCMATQQGGAEIRTDDKAPTLTAAAGMSGNNQPVIYIQGNYIDRADTAKCNGEGFEADVSSTLAAGQHDASGVYSIDRAAFNQGENAKYDFEISDSGVNSTLVSKGPSAVACGFPLGFRPENTRVYEDVATTVCSGTRPGYCNGLMWKTVDWIVRRLTPLECERLQGYPDGWTDIGDWTDSKGKVHKSSDSARYKALGNSIALPPWMWILQRLSDYCITDRTMASLFDGIGGFPLIWERINGKGSCLWASEIEEFPIAVTKLRFGG